MVRTYENAQELKEKIGAAFRKYIAEFDDIPEALKDKRIDEVERTPATTPPKRRYGKCTGSFM